MIVDKLVAHHLVYIKQLKINQLKIKIEFHIIQIMLILGKEILIL
jgi:hypothetical protein